MSDDRRPDLPAPPDEVRVGAPSTARAALAVVLLVAAVVAIGGFWLMPSGRNFDVDLARESGHLRVLSAIEVNVPRAAGDIEVALAEGQGDLNRMGLTGPDSLAFFAEGTTGATRRAYDAIIGFAEAVRAATERTDPSDVNGGDVIEVVVVDAEALAALIDGEAREDLVNEIRAGAAQQVAEIESIGFHRRVDPWLRVLLPLAGVALGALVVVAARRLVAATGDRALVTWLERWTVSAGGAALVAIVWVLVRR